jgi:hypothetical protein
VFEGAKGRLELSGRVSRGEGDMYSAREFGGEGTVEWVGEVTEPGRRMLGGDKCINFDSMRQRDWA